VTDPADFISAYRAGALKDLFALAPHDTAAALELPRAVQDDALVTALARYARKLAAPPAVFAALEQLQRPDARAVVTGQQVALLLGPMFTLAKAVSAINLAHRLTSEARPVVPIFWLATQDHDSAEIDHAHLLDSQEVLHRLALPIPAQVPAGRIRLQPAWLTHIREALRHLPGVTAHRAEVLALLEQTAAHAESFADWFAALLYALLGNQGLIVVNPLEPDIAPLLAPLLAAELAEPLASAQAVNQAAEALRRRGFTPQLGRGEGATNLFLEENGMRRLLRFDGEGLATEVRSYRREELQVILAQEPSLITPAAGLRPVAQDFLLPTAITVVGPGELRYMAQLKGVYEARGVAMPLLWPRASVALLEPPAARLLDKYRLTVSDIVRCFETTEQAVLLSLHGHGERFEAALARLRQEAAVLFDEVQAIDPTLRRPVERGRDQLTRTVLRLRGKTAAALFRQDKTTVSQLARLALHLRPEGVPQERLLSPVSFFLKFGTAYVMQQLLALPPEGEHTIRL
jgi:bacillithiol biosynthesis cysteine-adding enzyme BshC